MKAQNLTMRTLQSRVAEAFSMSRISGLTNAQECELMTRRIWQELARKYKNGRPVYSRYLLGYAQGLIDAHRAENYRDFLEFCYIDAAGVKYSTRKGVTRSTEEFFAAGRGHELGKMPSGHFWIANGKPYFTVEN